MSRCYIYLDEQTSKFANCTKDHPCKFLSKEFNESYQNLSEIHIHEDINSTLRFQIFKDMLLFCSKNNIKLFGVNQTINGFNYSINLTNSNSLFLENFTFSNIDSLLFQINTSKVFLNKITFTHCKSQIMKVEQSNLELMSCTFIHNLVKNFSMLDFLDSNIKLTNCSFFSNSQFPLFEPIIKINGSDLFFYSCDFVGNYVNQAFFELFSSKCSFYSNKIYKNCGNFFIKSLDQSNTSFVDSDFGENSCLLFYSLSSTFSIQNTSISQNCMSESFCLFNQSFSRFYKSKFISNSCGPILNSFDSRIEIIDCDFLDNISPSNLISINSGKIDVKSSIWINTTTAFGSSVSAFMTTFTISNSTFNSSVSRINGASISAKKTKFESISNTFVNSQSLMEGLSLYFAECNDNPFLIDKNLFNNSKNTNKNSIFAFQCSGRIQNSIFNRSLDEEIQISLYDNCINCSFQKNSNKEENAFQLVNYAAFINSFDDDFNVALKIFLFIILILIIAGTLHYRKKLRFCFRRVARKLHK